MKAPWDFITGFRYELPDGTISTSEFSDEYNAYLAGCKLTWGHPDWKIWQVKVVNPAGDRVPTYTYCDRCNYDNHQCPGCGGDMPHESSGVHEDCARELES